MLQILCGPDRTANSMRILDQICENARAGVAGQILIVPEQYSHETERALCARGGDTISRYAEVLSFTRLAARVFSVCGGDCEEYQDENGRVLPLYHAAQQVREQLKFYAAGMTRPDFLRQLGALMEELLTSCIPPVALHAAAARLEGRLAQKVTVLSLLGKGSGHQVRVDMTGGQLMVDVEREGNQVTNQYLTGPTNNDNKGQITDEAL